MSIDKVYSVSIVYSRQIPNKIEHALRSVIIYSVDEDQAYGSAIRLTQAQLEGKDWMICLKTCLEVNEHFLAEITNQ